MTTGNSDQAGQEPTTPKKASVSRETQGHFRPPARTPQETVTAIWTALQPDYPGKVTQILPQNSHAGAKAEAELEKLGSAYPLSESYNTAKANCTAAVNKIVEECTRSNLRYTDTHFDIGRDLKQKNGGDCLYPLSYDPRPEDKKKGPRAVKRVHQIFDKPEFYVDDATPPDIRQGTWNDCWVLAALGCLGGAGLIKNICVARDEEIGVYGFVFHRDGVWEHTIIDDKLYLTHADYDESLTEKREWMRSKFRSDPEEEYRRAFQVGSRALYFAGCTTENETWLPLLEKAFAKAHGDYRSLDVGYTGEAIEDLTGGVTSELLTDEINKTEILWKQLLQVNRKYLFGASTGRLDTWQGGHPADRKGIQASHAYSIIDAKEEINPRNGKSERLLRILNPWGKIEWTGPWSDGSKEWTDIMRERLKHESADDGIFWMSYSDLLTKFHFLDRTRLFDDDWFLTQQWTSIQVPWSTANYHATKFTCTLEEQSPIVVALSQLDDRYWRGLEGQYDFSLYFRINKAGQKDYIACSHGNHFMRRSVNVELASLEAGTYDVHMKVTAVRYQNLPTVDKVIVDHLESRQAKLTRTAFSYDMAHAKGRVRQNEGEKSFIAGQRDQTAMTEAAKVTEHLKRSGWNLGKKARSRKKRGAAQRKAQQELATVQESLAGGPVLQIPTTTKAGGIAKRRSRRHRSRHNSNTSASPNSGELHGIPMAPRPDQLPQGDYLSGATQDRARRLHGHDAGKSPDFRSTMSYTPSTSSSTTDTADENTGSELLDHQGNILDQELVKLGTNPWNAVCVVGIRIFTTTSTTKVTVESENNRMRDGSLIGENGFEAVGSGFSSYGDRAVAFWASQLVRAPSPQDFDDNMRGFS